ncbi:hypothetical protein FKW77_005079 [Venturia effusa]|uniref:Uncharacterized protein n=1 Tax=Venturia effusa TaxID=50376 RepID=A0A517LLE9_9PEZI|nr:hypothetical protein FKW77_005079 [Venturia effusa]
MPNDSKWPDAVEGIKSAGRRMSAVLRRIPPPDHIAEIRASLPREARNMRVDTNVFNRLSTQIQDGTRAAEILITNTQDITPPQLEDLPRKIPDAARLLLAASQTLKEEREKGDRFEEQLQKAKEEFSAKEKKRIDKEIEDEARKKAEILCAPLATEKAKAMTKKIQEDAEISAKRTANIRFANWRENEIANIDRQKDRLWQDRYEEWKDKEWDKLTKAKKKHNEDETVRITEEAKTTYEEYVRTWTENAKANQAKEIAEGIEKYVTGDKRKRDETEAEMRKQIRILTNLKDERGRTIKKLKTRLEACTCGANDSEDEDHKPDGPVNPNNTDRAGAGGGGRSGEDSPSNSGARPSGNGSSGNSGTGSNPSKKPSPPTGPRKITDPRDRDQNGTGVQDPPSNPHNQDRNPPSGGDTAPDRPTTNPFDTAQKRPPGGWPEEQAAREPLTQTPFDEQYERMIRELHEQAEAKAADPTTQTKLHPAFGSPSVKSPYPAPGQFGAPSNPTVAEAGGNKPTPVFGTTSRIVNGGDQTPDIPDTSAGTGGGNTTPVFGSTSRTMNGGYLPDTPRNRQ